MTSNAFRTRLVVLVLSALSFAYSPLGWCPPPPDGGGILPHLQTFSFGNVALNQPAQLRITYFVNPVIVVPGPFIIASPPYAFTSNQDGAFSVDLAHTSCATGISIATTSGCVVTIAFTPISPGLQQAQFVLSGCIGTPSPCLPGFAIGSILSFTGFGVSAPIPELSLTGMLLLAGLLLASGFFSLSRRVRAP